MAAVAAMIMLEVNMHKKNALNKKVAVPILIVLAIAVIWLAKHPHIVKAPDAVKTDTRVADTAGITGVDFTLETTDIVDFDTLTQHGLPIIVDYGSDSCIPCKAMAPVLETLNKEFAGKAFIKFVDVWKYANAASNVPVQVIPTQVLVNADGSPFSPSDSLIESIDGFVMYSHRETGEHIFTVHQGGLTEQQMRAILKEMGLD